MTAGIVVARVELDALPAAHVHVGPDGTDAFVVIPTRDGPPIALHASSPDAPWDRVIAAIQEAQHVMRTRRSTDQHDADFWALIEGNRDGLDDTVSTPLAAITAGPTTERERP